MKTSRKLFICLTLSLLALGSVSRSAGAQGFKWWQNERFQKELALTPDQSARLESCFQALQPTLRAQKRALDKLEDELSTIIHDAQVQEPEVEQFVARVEAARADLSKTRTLMLYRMRRILTTDQHMKLLKLLEIEEKERKSRGHGPGRKQ
jgi:Spy/CpxP family protein refolding chaperone